MAAGPELSLVLPILDEQEVLPELDRRLRATLADLPGVNGAWEVIFVDDGSRDRSRELLGALAASEPRYKVICLSRNFGHQMAITAGIDRAEGEAVVVMDADLQDPPEVVRAMVEKWREGYDVVYAVRARRQGETLFKRFTAAVYYRLLRALLGMAFPVDAGDFRLMARPVVLTLRALRERHRFIRGLVAWVGFRQVEVKYDRPARFAGQTKFSLRRMLRFALDGITSFSVVPLRAASWLGLFAGLVGVATAAWAAYVKLAGKGVVPGWTTIMMLVALSSSVQLLMIGVLGEYVGRIYEEVKGRPLYVVSEEINLAASAREDRSSGSLEDHADDKILPRNKRAGA
jgi:glycosyltransferase involved in cell wall biosynthesis